MLRLLQHYRLFLLTLCAAITVSACERNSYISHPSVNYNPRVSMIIIHHTTINFQESLDILTKASNNSVSAHYLVPAPNDPTYPYKQLKTHALVPEALRAWHAGASFWAGKSGLNDQSIGIELVYEPSCIENKSPEVSTIEIHLTDICRFDEYSDEQLNLLYGLLSDLTLRYPEIKPVNIIGHSDIAPNRKVDPGPKFPWEKLYEMGFGAWYDDDTLRHYQTRFANTPVDTALLQKALGLYGYYIEETGVLDPQTRKTVRAFQLHFQPDDISGLPSTDTAAILFALLDKYHPEKLKTLDIKRPIPFDSVNKKIDLHH